MGTVHCFGLGQHETVRHTFYSCPLGPPRTCPPHRQPAKSTSLARKLGAQLRHVLSQLDLAVELLDLVEGFRKQVFVLAGLGQAYQPAMPRELTLLSQREPESRNSTFLVASAHRSYESEAIICFFWLQRVELNGWELVVANARAE